MSKKSRHRERLDTYYYLAKEQGYRSRAAFKLIQLNQKYNFLSRSNFVVDLCAAPGGWLQIAGVSTIVGNITFQKSSKMLKHELRNNKADLVLHDGAPNVGANALQDAFTQNELVLASLKLSSQLLRKGGVFITKIFRSRDYTSLLYVANALFNRVEVTKPDASRSTSSEIYVCCFDYKDPNVIDPKLLNANFVFKEVVQKKSLKQHLRTEKNPKRRNRTGYESDYTTFFHAFPVAEFVSGDRPVDILIKGSCLEFQENSPFHSHPSTTDEIKKLCEDLRIIDRSDFRRLLKWRGKMRHFLFKEIGKNEPIPQPSEDILVVNEEEDLGDLSLNELQNEVQRISKKDDRYQRKQIEKTILRRKGRMPIPKEMFERSSDAIDTLYNENLFRLDSISSEEALKLVSNQNVETLNPVMSEEQQFLEKVRRKQEKEIQNLKEYLGKEDYDLEMEGDFDELYNNFLKVRSKHQQHRDREFNENIKQERDFLKEKIQEELEESVSTGKKVRNPLLLQITADENQKSSDDWFQQSSLKEIDENASKMLVPVEDTFEPSTKRRKLNSGELKEIVEVDDNQIEEVPAEMYDQEMGATTLAIAKKMLKKKERTEWIDGAHNRYAFNDVDQLPRWFKDDYNRHSSRMLPVTKEEVEEQKERYQNENIRPIKKVAEATFRKKRKMLLKRKHMVRKANEIAQRSDVTNQAKISALQNIYKSFKERDKKKRVYVLPHQKVKRKRGQQVIRVDSRMKSDKRNKKNIRK